MAVQDRLKDQGIKNRTLLEIHPFSWSEVSLIRVKLGRQFIRGNYLDVMKSNPYFLFIVRECENAQPTVMARYGKEERF